MDYSLEHPKASEAKADPERSVVSDTDVAAREQSAELQGANVQFYGGQLDRRRLGEQSTPANAQSSELQFSGAEREAAILSTARDGISGTGGALPHLDKIQASFGRHDVGQVVAHTDSAADGANQAMGSRAFAMGNHVALGSTTDLHTVAHEAAHTVQQKAGVQLKGGVGEAGDRYERHADAVADRVVQGKSAEDLLDQMSGAGAGGPAVQQAVQFIGTPLDKSLPSGASKPKYGEDKGKQRRYSREQYIELWEQEQGRKMTSAERKTIDRGCIGITATNLRGGGNPLDSAEAIYGDFDAAIKDMQERNATADWWSNLPVVGGMFSDHRYIVFAKLFWSNQDKSTDRSKPDPNAYKPDPKTGKVDMTGYKYLAQPGGYVNFDYGFWDEATQSFWHANHMEYSDPVKRAADPMKVLQSTKDKFAAGYIDFDRVVYGVALAKNYDPGLAALANAGSGN